MVEQTGRQSAMVACLLLLVTACGGDVYVRDGLGDGNTFALSNNAFESTDPATQSWVSYSLIRSTCQLRNGSANPARTSTFNCEVTSRRHLLDKWTEQKEQFPGASDEYLDTLTAVQQADFLSEYVVRFFRQENWQLPADLKTFEFRQWSVEYLPEHFPQTNMTGTWSFVEQ
jgi:hypothetical protein